MFILVSTPSSPLSLSQHGHKLLLLAPIIEGTLGGWSTLQAATSAYISDCTSSGSRAHIFSRFSGVSFLGIFIGPSISGYLISHSRASVGEIGEGTGKGGGVESVTSVFWVAVVCSFLNFLAAVFVFPESLTKERREVALKEYSERRYRRKGKAAVRGGGGGGGVGGGSGEGRGDEDRQREEEEEEEEEEETPNFLVRFFSPLAVFLPVRVRDPVKLNRYRTDWSLTLLAVAFFCSLLCVVSVVLSWHLTNPPPPRGWLTILL